MNNPETTSVFRLTTVDLNSPLSPDRHARLVDAAMDLTFDEIPVEEKYVFETVRRHIGPDGGLTLTHVIKLLDGTRPIESHVDYHLDPEEPTHSRVAFSIHSPTEGFSIRSNRPKQMIVENPDGEVIHMFDPTNPNGTSPRYTELAEYAQGFWTDDTTIHSDEESSYRMRTNDALVLADLMTGKTTATKPVERHFSGNRVKDAAKNLFLRAKRSF